MSRLMTTEWKHLKSFANEKNLMKFIDENKDNGYDDHLFVVRTPEGRWTAIAKLDTSKGGYLARWPFLSM